MSNLSELESNDDPKKTPLDIDEEDEEPDEEVGDAVDDDDEEEEEDDDDEEADEEDDDDEEDDVNKESPSIDLTSENIEDLSPINSDIDSDDDNYLQKFNIEENNQYINQYHPECLVGNSIEIENLAKVIRDKNNNIIDDNHKTQPFLTKYERTKILGQRASQINAGAQSYINVPKNIIEGYLIAQLELTAKKIPVIIRRPLPNNKSEYWKLEDLEQL